MNLATLILLAVKTSVVLVVLGLALNANLKDATCLFRRPRQLARSLLSMNVVMPLFAATLANAFELHLEVKIALIALALSPVPPVLPQKTLKAGGEESYTVGLLVTAAMLAIVFIPLAMKLLAIRYAMSLHMSPVVVGRIVLVTVLAPMAVGILIRRVAPTFAKRATRPVSWVAMVLLALAVLPILFTSWSDMVSLIGNGTLTAIIMFVVTGLVVGHLLGGPASEDRIVLALSTASRHPGVALAIASANFPGQEVAPAILLYLLVSAIISIPYLIWRRRAPANGERSVKLSAA